MIQFANYGELVQALYLRQKAFVPWCHENEAHVCLYKGSISCYVVSSASKNWAVIAKIDLSRGTHRSIIELLESIVTCHRNRLEIG